MSLGVVFNWLDECVGVSALEFGDVYYNVYILVSFLLMYDGVSQTNDIVVTHLKCITGVCWIVCVCRFGE